ncbi:hypothetical protein ACFQ7W_30070 [Streptomyces niveus]|uniref:hypothetical protein n=1 Tax=Streptomyces niveus TaxID=193462 RepID=UPI00367D73B5
MESIRLVVGFVEFTDSLHDLGGAGELESDSPDTLFEFSLDVFVEGIAARARRRGPGA